MHQDTPPDKLRHESMPHPPWLRLLRGLLFVGHPFATSMNAGLGTVSFLIAERRAGVNFDDVTLFASIWFVFYSIGSMNDYCDKTLDELALRQEKPLVAGDLSPIMAQYLWVVTALAGFVAAYHFNLSTVCIAVLVWWLGVAYNVWAKRSMLSWLPFVLALPSLPVWGFVAAGRVTPELFLSYPLGALLAIGLHIANTLPDLDRDTKGGVMGFTHKLGRVRAVALLWFSFATSIILVALVSATMSNSIHILRPAVVVAAILLIIMIADWLVHRSPKALQRGYYLSAIFAAVLAFSWVISLP
jgi:geranylgeranylglycerol-phosphate geranylgeranyltransferase